MGRFIFPIFWLALGIVATILFHFNKNVDFKRKYFRWYIIAAGILFALYIALFIGTGRWAVILFFGSAVGFIAFLNIKYTIFCDNCGRTVYNNPMMTTPWFSKVKYCAKCGAKLKE